MAALVPALLVLFRCCCSELPDFIPGNNLLLGNLYDLPTGKDIDVQERKNNERSRELENIKFSQWGSWSCWCQRKIQIRRRKLIEVEGLAFVNSHSLRQEKPCSQFECPECAKATCL